jgi:hypothetical protein
MTSVMTRRVVGRTSRVNVWDWGYAVGGYPGTGGFVVWTTIVATPATVGVPLSTPSEEKVRPAGRVVVVTEPPESVEETKVTDWSVHVKPVPPAPEEPPEALIR